MLEAIPQRAVIFRVLAHNFLIKWLLMVNLNKLFSELLISYVNFSLSLTVLEYLINSRWIVKNKKSIRIDTSFI